MTAVLLHRISPILAKTKAKPTTYRSDYAVVISLGSPGRGVSLGGFGGEHGASKRAQSAEWLKGICEGLVLSEIPVSVTFGVMVCAALLFLWTKNITGVPAEPYPPQKKEREYLSPIEVSFSQV